MPAMTGMISTLTFNKSRMEDMASAGFSLATDIAEWLVRQGVTFREAHEISGKLVSFCEENGLELHEPSDEQYREVSIHLKPEVRKVLNVSSAIEGRNGAGGTSSKQVIEQLVQLRKLVGKAKK